MWHYPFNPSSELARIDSSELVLAAAANIDP